MMANPDHGQGTLYLSGGESSWPVTYRIRTEEGPGRTVVTGTITFISSPAATRAELQDYMRDPQEFFLLRLGGDRWVRHLFKDLNLAGDVVGEISHGYILDPPPWVEKDGA